MVWLSRHAENPAEKESYQDLEMEQLMTAMERLAPVSVSVWESVWVWR